MGSCPRRLAGRDAQDEGDFVGQQVEVGTGEIARESFSRAAHLMDQRRRKCDDRDSILDTLTWGYVNDVWNRHGVDQMTGLDRALLDATAAGELDGLRDALQRGANVDAQDLVGDTALCRAADLGHAEIVEYLIEAGADVDRPGTGDKSPLMNAALAGHSAIVHLLLAHGAEVDDALLDSLRLKVEALEENAEDGFVDRTAALAWRRFFDYIATHRKRRPG